MNIDWTQSCYPVNRKADRKKLFILTPVRQLAGTPSKKKALFLRKQSFFMVRAASDAQCLSCS